MFTFCSKKETESCHRNKEMEISTAARTPQHKCKMRKLNAKRGTAVCWMLLEEPAGHGVTNTQEGHGKKATTADFEL